MTRAMFDATTVGNVNLLAAVPVAAGAVVRKTLVDTLGCKMFVFAMDAGQAIREHHEPYVATLQVLDGRLEFGTAGHKHVLAAYDWLVVPFDEQHDLLAVEATRFLLTLSKQAGSARLLRSRAGVAVAP